MGLFMSKFSDLLQSWGQGQPKRMLLLGLDGAGKTSILYKVKLNENITTIPTIGFNVETVTPCKGISFTVWDVGGQYKIRQLWRYYYDNSEGLIYVVDSTDSIRIEESAEELHGILSNDSMRNVPVVIFANKQDMPNAMSCTQIVENLRLNGLPNKQKWFIQNTCAMTGEGLYEGFHEMSKMVKENENKKNQF